MDFQGNLLGCMAVHGLVDTSDRLETGDVLCWQAHSRRVMRAVVPRRHTHVKVKGFARSGWLAWWQAGFGSAEACPELRDAVHGRHPDVLRYLGPSATSTFEIPDRGYADLDLSALDGSARAQLKSVGRGQFRGGVRLPAGPALLHVDSLVRWSLTVRG